MSVCLSVSLSFFLIYCLRLQRASGIYRRYQAELLHQTKHGAFLPNFAPAQPEETDPSGGGRSRETDFTGMKLKAHEKPPVKNLRSSRDDHHILRSSFTVIESIERTDRGSIPLQQFASRRVWCAPLFRGRKAQCQREEKRKWIRRAATGDP